MRSRAPRNSFKPCLLATAIAAAFTTLPTAGLANPSGGVAVHGQAVISNPAPKQLLVSTQNGAGTSHSAINWQSFSIGAGETTRFVQPSAGSTSINRVVTNTPSAIFGTLTSNGKLVLVNQSGIAVGLGASIDTAGFTASVLSMTEADAKAGRLRFSLDSLAGQAGPLTVQGNIIARNGDVVLIAPSVELAQSAVVQAEGGSAILVAGQSVEVTGRGLEGISMVLQAPTDQAINLGTLKGDAVGIFAGTLKHSGLIQANQVSVEGGRVVLKAGGDAYVDGRIEATGGTRGGSVDVLGQRVALTGEASIDVSGLSSGGSIRIGGDYQGKNPEVPNADKTYLGSATSLRADATHSGAGGRIIVWADDQTLAYGAISARGGAQGGNGGFAEVSGKGMLDFRGQVDLSAPQGRTGTLLLDPLNITIGAIADVNGDATTGDDVTGSIAAGAFPGATSLITAAQVSTLLNSANLSLAATNTITVNQAITKTSGTAQTLTLDAGNAIAVNAAISGSAGSPLGVSLVAGGNITVAAPINTFGGDFTATGAGAASTMTVTNNVQAAAMTLNLAGGLTVQSGAGQAALNAAANQTIDAKYIEVLASGINAASIITTAGTQGLTTHGKNVAGAGLVVTTTGSGDALIRNNVAFAAQNITVIDADLMQVRSLGATGTGSASINTNSPQTVMVRGTGNNLLVVGDAGGAGSSSIFGPNQTVTAGQSAELGGIQIVGGTTGTKRAFLSNTAGGSNQAITTTGTLSVVGGSALFATTENDAAGAFIYNNAVNNQTVTANAITMQGGTAGSFNTALLGGEGSQSITVGAGGISLTGGSGTGIRNLAGFNQKDVAGTQSVTVNNGGSIILQGGSSSGIGVPNNGSSFAGIESSGVSQTINFTAGGDVRLTGGTVGAGNNSIIQMHNGTQTISGASLIQLRGGTSGGAVNNGNVAYIESDVGNQSISAQTITLQGGGGGSNNAVNIGVNSSGTGTQSITANSISLQGGVAGTFNGAAIYTGNGRNQTVNVGAGGLNLTGGGGGGVTDLQNAAVIFQKTGTGTQTINVAGGGAITLQAGSGAASNVGFDTNGLSKGSFASIVSQGAAQLVNFTAPGGSISATGGTFGTNNVAGIEASGGPQTIRGSVLANAPTISLTGGASGGNATEDNGGFIFTGAAGLQTISAKTTTLQAGGGLIDNSARIVAGTQQIDIAGNLSLTGGSSASSFNVGGVRIGGRGSTNTNLTLNVSGNLALLAGGTSGGAIGTSSDAVGKTNTIAITTGGDFVMTPSANGNVRLGSPSADIQGGSISVTAGGNIVINASGGTGTAFIRSLGNVTLSAPSGSIAEADGALIRANLLTASAASGISLDSQTNQLTVFNATNTASGAVSVTNATGSLLAVTGITQTGGNVRISADDLDITGPVTAGAGTVTLRPITLARDVAIEFPAGGGVMSLSPADLQQVTAGVLEVGRLDGTGNVNVNGSLANANINSATLRLVSGNNINSTAGGSIGTGGGAFNVELRANNDVQFTNGNVILGDNRSLTIVADNDSSGVGNVNIGAVTLQAGASGSNATGNMSTSGRNINVVTSGGGSALLKVTGAGTQTFAATNNLGFANSNPTSGTINVNTGSGLQSLSAGGSLTVTAGTGTGTSTFISSGNGNQSISASGVAVTAGAAGGGSGTGNFAIVKSFGTQTVTVGAGGLTLTGGGGALTDNTAQIFQAGTSGTSQTITVNGGGTIALTGGSSALTNVGGSGHGSRALIEADGDSQLIQFAAGGAVNLTGGTVGSRAFAQIYAKTGTQTISGAPAITLTGGATGGFASEGNTAGIYADGAAQTISASALTLTGGASGIDNRAEIVGQFDQGITVSNAPAVSIRARAGKAGLFAAGNQTLSITGAASTNALTIGDVSTAEASYVTGNNQIVAVGSGGQSGSITIGGGTNAGKNSGIFNNVGTQTVSTTGTLSLTGGTAVGTGPTCAAAGSGSCAAINNNSTGLQSVSAATINVKGGSDGVANGAGIFVNGGTQLLTVGGGGLHLIGGTGTSDNFASIGGSGANGQTLTINVAGNTTLDALNSTTGSSAFIGLGGTGDLGSVTINLTGTGNLTMTGSNVSATRSGAAIGAGSNQTNATVVVNINAADVILNPGTQSGARFGHAAGADGPGDVTVVASGNIAFNTSGSVGTGVRTTGNVSLTAGGVGKSISEGANSGVSANALTVSADSGVNLSGANLVNTLNASSTGTGGISFSNTQSLTLGPVTTSVGAQAINISTVGGSSALSLAGVVADDNWTLVSGGATTLGGAFSGNSLSLTSGAALVLTQNISTTGNLSLITPNANTITQAGGSIVAGGQTSINAVSADVTLTGIGNDFNQVGATGGVVRIRDVNALSVGNSNLSKMVVQTGGNLALNGAIAASGSGDAVTLVSTAGTFNATGGAITAPSGRWLLYLAAPGANNFAALTPAFKQYGATLGSTILGTGNGLLYGLSPSITGVLGTGVVASKAYDTLTSIDVSNPAITVTASGVQAGDTVTLSKVGTGALADKNVGTGKSVTVGVQIASATAGAAPVFGYTFLDTGTTSSTASASIGTVTGGTLAVTGVSAANKVYDSTTAAALTGTATVSALGSDVVSVSGVGAGSFNNKNVGIAKPVTVTGYTLTGTDAGNYTVVQPAGLTANISAASITGISGITAASKVYDSTTSAALTTSGAAFTGRLGSDALTVGSSTGAFGDKNVGVGKTVNITGLSLGGTDAGNYTLASSIASTTADISAANLVLSTAAVSKTYDGTLSAAGTPIATGGTLFSGDTLSAGTFAYTNANAGVGNKTVTVSGVTVSDGNGGANYSVSYAANTVSTINKANLTISTSSVSKTYDGTLGMTGATGQGAVVTGGTLFANASNGNVLDSLSGGTFAYLDKNAGTGKSVSTSGVTVNDGNGGGNYNVSYANNTTSSISQRALSTWTGSAGDGLWSSAGNWDAIPDLANAQSVSIPSGAGTVQYNLAGTQVKNVTVGAGTTLAVTGGDLSVATALNAGSYSQSGGAYSGAGSVSVTSNFSMTGGSFSPGGNITINHGSGDLVLTGVTLESTGGSVNITTAGALSVVGGAQPAAIKAKTTMDLTVAGLNLTGTSTSASLMSGNSMTINSSGPVVLTGGAGINAFALIDPTVSGDINLSSISLTLQGGSGSGAYASILNPNGNIFISAPAAPLLVAGFGGPGATATVVGNNVNLASPPLVTSSVVVDAVTLFLEQLETAALEQAATEEKKDAVAPLDIVVEGQVCK